MRAVYMIKRGAHWVKHPALVTSGFPYASFKRKIQAQQYAENFVKQPYKIVLVHLRMWEPAL